MKNNKTLSFFNILITLCALIGVFALFYDGKQLRESIVTSGQGIELCHIGQSISTFKTSWTRGDQTNFISKRNYYSPEHGIIAVVRNSVDLPPWVKPISKL